MLKEKVEKAIERIKPLLNRDGGDISLVSVDEDAKKVVVALEGACSGCPMSQMTLKNSVERIIKEEAPEVEIVESA
ncbi:NifU family protein [bacterium]